MFRDLPSLKYRDNTSDTTADDVDEKNNSSFNAADRSIMAVDDANESSINAGNPTEMCSSTNEIIELTNELDSLYLASKKAESLIQSDAAIKQARRSIRRSLDPLRGYVGVLDEVRTRMPELGEAGIHALLNSDLEELPIHKEIEEVRDGFRRNFGITTRSMSGQPYHLSRTESLDKFRALPQVIRMSAEKKRAQMVDWIFGLTARIKKLECVPSLPDMTYFSAVDILDCALKKHAKRIYRLSDKTNRPVLIAAVKLAATKEMETVDEEALLSALRSFIDGLGYRDKDIKHWENEHTKTFDFNTNAPKNMQPIHPLEKLQKHWHAKTFDFNTNTSTHIQSKHLVQELRQRWSMINSIMKPDQFQSGWLMIETLASFAVSKANLLKRHNSLLLTSAIMHIALEFFASWCRLDEPLLTSKMIQLLLGNEIEHVPVAFELLDWILSVEMILPALTEKMKEAKSELQKINEGIRHMWMSQS